MKKRSAFTLIELILVVAILGILGALILPRFSVTQKTAKDSADRAQYQMVNTMLELYLANVGTKPGTLASIEADINYFPDGVPKGPDGANWTCPWNSSYIYNATNGRVNNHFNATGTHP